MEAIITFSWHWCPSTLLQTKVFPKTRFCLWMIFFIYLRPVSKRESQLDQCVLYRLSRSNLYPPMRKIMLSFCYLIFKMLSVNILILIFPNSHGKTPFHRYTKCHNLCLMISGWRSVFAKRYEWPKLTNTSSQWLDEGEPAYNAVALIFPAKTLPSLQAADLHFSCSKRLRECRTFLV